MGSIIDALQFVSPIATWTVVPEQVEFGAKSSHPPFVAWRYQQPSTQVAHFLRGAISTFPGTTPWEFVTVRPRWLLMPARIAEYAKLHRCDGGLIAAAKLKAADPEFGIRANVELGLLADFIRLQWETNRKGRE